MLIGLADEGAGARHLPNDLRATQLQRAAMPRLMDGDPDPPEKIRPRTTLLRDGLDRTPRSAEDFGSQSQRLFCDWLGCVPLGSF